jgi:putative ABC transport system permease protein
MRRLFRFPWRTSRQIGRDVDEELAFHLDMRVEALIALGMSAAAARDRALREFGDLEDARRYIGAVDRGIETTRRRSDYMRDLWTDIGYAVRKLRAAPGFTVAVMATLAVGIGANTAIFSVVNGVLLRAPAFPQADHLVRVRYTQQGHPDVGTPMDLVDNRTHATKFVGFSVIEGMTANLVRDGADAERVQGVHVNANWFSLLRVSPLAGRFFAEGDDQPGGRNVVVISEALWRRDFRADSGIVGKMVRINSTPFTIIGIVPRDRGYPFVAELWVPRRFTEFELTNQSRGARWLAMLARVRDDVDLATADKDVERVSALMETQFPEVFRERRAHLVTVQEYTVGDVRKPLFIMLGAVGLVLLIACANVANLMLVRATVRESEMAVRTALGAGRGRLVRQLMTESVLLALCGAAAGLAVAKVGASALLARAPQGVLLTARASIDGTTLGLTAIVAIMTGLAFGLLPSIQVARDDLVVALRAGAHGSRSHPAANRTKRFIVVGEVALAVMLLAGAGLLLHSFVKLLSIDPGFKPQHVISMRLSLPQNTYDSTRRRAFVRELESRAKAVPGVRIAALSTGVPLDGSSYGFSFLIRGRPAPRPSEHPNTEVRLVTPDFFRAMGTPVLQGRGIDASDQPGVAPAVVVNKAFAARFFPNDNPLGQSITLEWGEDPAPVPRRIVGVVSDMRGNALAEAPEPTVYIAMAQYQLSSLYIVARTNGDPASLASGLRGIVRDLDREVPVYSVQTMEERVAASLGRERFFATLVAVFAAAALLLAAVGLYGVISYAVTQRTHELGVRVALGASGTRISRMVIGEGIALTTAGLVVGIVAAAGASRMLGSLLYGVDAADSLTLAGVVGLLAAVAVLASWIPARRASRVDPLVAMRGD